MSITLHIYTEVWDRSRNTQRYINTLKSKTWERSFQYVAFHCTKHRPEKSAWTLEQHPCAMKAFSLLPLEVSGLHCVCGKGHMAWGARVVICCGVVPQPLGRTARRDSSGTWTAEAEPAVQWGWWPMTWRRLKYSAAFASVTASKISMQEFQAPETRNPESWCWGAFYLEICEPDRLPDTQVLRELANDVAGPLLFKFEWPGRLRDLLVDWKRENTTLQENQEEDLGILGYSVSPKPLVIWCKRILLESFSKRWSG